MIASDTADAGRKSVIEAPPEGPGPIKSLGAPRLLSRLLWSLSGLGIPVKLWMYREARTFIAQYVRIDR